MPPFKHDPPAVSASHALSQLPSIYALLKVGASAPFKGTATEQAIAAIQTPGRLVSVTLPATPQSILDEYAVWTTGSKPGGGQRGAALVPPHLFPQWTFPPMIEALAALPFPMTAILNQGCKLEVHGPLPAGHAMQCTAQLVEVVREPSKIKITTKITTGTHIAGPACTAFVYAVIPQKAAAPRSTSSMDGLGGPARREPATVPTSAETVSEHVLSSSSGRHYAFLSGDFNPIHSLAMYARMAGFPSSILHGFAQMALMQEVLVRSRCEGTAGRLLVLDVRFVAPLVLPNKMAVHVDDPGAPATATPRSGSVYATNGTGDVTMIGQYTVAAGESKL